MQVIVVRGRCRLSWKRKYIAGMEAALITELESLNDWLLNNTSHLSIWVTHTQLYLERRENYANVTILILYVMEMSLNQSQLSPI